MTTSPSEQSPAEPAPGRAAHQVREVAESFGSNAGAKFEDWDPAGRQFDAVVAGQAWHWVDPVAGATQAAKALRPGGRLALFWNSFLPPSGMGEVMARLPGPDTYTTLCNRAADAMRQTGMFGDPELWRFDRDQRYTRDEWLDVWPTFGANNRLSPEQLREVLAGLGKAVDAIGGAFTMRYATVAVSATIVPTVG